MSQHVPFLVTQPCSLSEVEDPLCTHHTLSGLPGALDWGTLGSMPIAEAIPSDHHVIDGVIVLLFDLHTGIQQVISERMQFGELHPQVGDLQHVWTKEQSVMMNPSTFKRKVPAVCGNIL